MNKNNRNITAIVLSLIMIAAAAYELRADQQKYPLPPKGKKVVDRAVDTDTAIYAVVYETKGKWVLDIYDKPDKSWNWHKAFSAEFKKEAEDAILEVVKDSSSVSFKLWQHLNVKPKRWVRFDRDNNIFDLVD